MQYPMVFKPLRRNYLLYLAGLSLIFVVGVILLRALVGFILLKAPLGSGLIWGGVGYLVASLVGFLLCWFYDERTKFKRFSIVLTETNISVLIGWLGWDTRTLPLTAIDRDRTLLHNSKRNLSNLVYYTFWSISGYSISINKLMLGSSQTKELLERTGCL